VILYYLGNLLGSDDSGDEEPEINADSGSDDEYFEGAEGAEGAEDSNDEESDLLDADDQEVEATEEEFLALREKQRAKELEEAEIEKQRQKTLNPEDPDYDPDLYYDSDDSENEVRYRIVVFTGLLSWNLAENLFVNVANFEHNRRRPPQVVRRL
jgi:hypothetical protein